MLLLTTLVACQPNNKDENNMSNNAKTNEQLDNALTVEEEKNIAALTEIWANALKIRDGKPRYEIMSEKAKQKFEQEQIIRSGEDWNFNIGDSSPWVVSYNIQIEDMTAKIEYAMKTSEPADSHMLETVVFVWENGKLLVDDYYSISQ